MDPSKVRSRAPRAERGAAAQSDDRVALGIDVGGTTTRVGLVTAAGEMRLLSSTPTERVALERFGEHLAARVAPAVACADITGIGIGMRGIIDAAGQRYRGGSLFSEPDSFDLVAHLSTSTGLPVRIANDVEAAGYAVSRWGGGGDDFAYINVGTGIGAAVFRSSRLVARHGGSQEEFADYIVHDRDGRYRRIEDVASGQGMARLVAGLSGEYPESPLARRDPATDAPLADVLRPAYVAGDAFARRIVEDAVAALALAIVNTEAIVDAGRYMLGGGVFGDGDWLPEMIRGAVAGIRSAAGLGWGVEIGLTSLGADRVGVLGAGALVLFSD